MRWASPIVYGGTIVPRINCREVVNIRQAQTVGLVFRVRGGFADGGCVFGRAIMFWRQPRLRIWGKSSLNASVAPIVTCRRLRPPLPVRSLTEECLPFRKPWATKSSTPSAISYYMKLELVTVLCRSDLRIQPTNCGRFPSGVCAPERDLCTTSNLYHSTTLLKGTKAKQGKWNDTSMS
jgi:hypothetical protein